MKLATQDLKFGTICHANSEKSRKLVVLFLPRCGCCPCNRLARLSFLDIIPSKTTYALACTIDPKLESSEK